jgi:Polyketide cyclase / dehydrase and lipid transport
VADYHFVSTWQIQAPIEQVWEEIYHAERWPSWWTYVEGVDELEPGDVNGVGKRLRMLFRTRLPYTLGFEVRVTRVEPPSILDAVAAGELEGTGRWRLTSVDGGTHVRYAWDVRTTQWWMNLLAPIARPAFNWNHHELMRAGGESLAKRLGTDLVVPDAPQQARPLSTAAGLAAAGAVAAALAVLGWRRRARKHER